jgi:hypothetical protein
MVFFNKRQAAFEPRIRQACFGGGGIFVLTDAVIFHDGEMGKGKVCPYKRGGLFPKIYPYPGPSGPPWQIPLLIFRFLFIYKHHT